MLKISFYFKNSEIKISTPNGLPRALLVLLDADRGVLVDRWINLSPQTSLLDFVRSAKVEAKFNEPNENQSMFNFKCEFLAVLGGCVSLFVLNKDPKNPQLQKEDNADGRWIFLLPRGVFKDI